MKLDPGLRQGDTRLPFIFLVLTLILTTCAGSLDGDPSPTDRLYYPGALLKNGNTLYVANTNLDNQFNNARVLQVNLSEQKIVGNWEAPSLLGQMAATDDFSNIFVTSQAQPVLSNVAQNNRTQLSQNAPYFLSLVPNKQAGILGTLEFAQKFPLADGQFSLFRDNGEIHYFEWANGQAAKIKQRLKVSDCLQNPSEPGLSVARLGGIKVTASNFYALVEAVINTGLRFEKKVFFIKSKLADIQQGKWGKCEAVDLSKDYKAQGARDIAISDDEKTAYILMAENPLLLKLNLESFTTISKESNTCLGSARMRLSPEQNTLVVLCPNENLVIAFDAPTLNLLGQFPDETTIERNNLGPVDLVFDKDSKGQFFVSFQNSNQIGVFNHEKDPKTGVNKRGLFFNDWLELPR